MTDKQIACAYLDAKLRWMVPEHVHLRDIAEAKLTEERCYRIVKRILGMIEKMREPLVGHLSNTNVDIS